MPRNKTETVFNAFGAFSAPLSPEARTGFLCAGKPPSQANKTRAY